VPFAIAFRCRRGTVREERAQRERVRTRGRVVPQRTKRSREQTLGDGWRRGDVMGLGRQHEMGDHETRVSELVELGGDDARRRRGPHARMGRRQRGRVSVRR